MLILAKMRDLYLLKNYEQSMHIRNSNLLRWLLTTLSRGRCILDLHAEVNILQVFILLTYLY